VALSAVDVEERHSVNRLSIIDLEYTVLEDTQTQVIEASFSIKGQATVIMEYDKTTPTPAHCIADFSLIPIGTKDVSFAKEISQVARMAKQSGLHTDIHEVGTVIGKSFL
jgi:hypothetical protein